MSIWLARLFPERAILLTVWSWRPTRMHLVDSEKQNRSTLNRGLVLRGTFWARARRLCARWVAFIMLRELAAVRAAPAVWAEIHRCSEVSRSILATLITFST